MKLIPPSDRNTKYSASLLAIYSGTANARYPEGNTRVADSVLKNYAASSCFSHDSVSPLPVPMLEKNNNVIETLLQHRSIRRFTSTPIDRHAIESILNAATRASSSGNMQCYSIIVSEDRSRIATLAELHFGQRVAHEARIILTFCVDLRRITKWCEQRGETPSFDNLWALVVGTGDAFIAAQNAAIAAESFGLGICYLGSTITNMEAISGFLECPNLVLPMTSIAIGWPAEQRNQTLRLPLEGVVHSEKFNDYSSTQIDAILNEKETRDWLRFCDTPGYKEKISEYNISNLAGVFTKLRHPREAVDRFSTQILTCIRKKMFRV